ncbi:MAG: DUF2797 domain-containing protein [Candidatus Saliniplasma sp.]
MFKQADTLLKDREKLINEKEVHVVSYRWDSFSPELKVFDGNDLIEVDLGKIDFNVSQEKTCIGSFEDGYTPCPHERNVDNFNQCSGCAPESIPNLECIFEPQNCSDCEGRFCEGEHAVYLAFHGYHTKIGMTKKSRIKTRLIEQGADAYSLLATLPHRKDARDEEKRLSEKLRISQRVSKKRKLKTLSKKVDKESIRTGYRSVKNRIPTGKLIFLNDYPISLPLRAVPRYRPTPGLHRGQMVGIKGEFLIYENNGLQALNLMDLLGRRMKVSGL